MSLDADEPYPADVEERVVSPVASIVPPIPRLALKPLAPDRFWPNLVDMWSVFVRNTRATTNAHGVPTRGGPQEVLLSDKGLTDGQTEVLKPRSARGIARNIEVVMNKDQVAGKAKEVAGKVQQAVGDATGSASQQIKGGAKQVEGKVQKGVGDVKDSLKEVDRKTR